MSSNQTAYRFKDPSGDPSIPALGVRFDRISEPNTMKNEKGEFLFAQPAFDSVLLAYVFPMGNAKSDVACEIERTLPDETVKVHPVHSRKYAEQIKLYKAGNTLEGVGTPLGELPGINAALIDTLRARGVHSIEALAEAAEVALNDLMGFRKWTNLAKAFLSQREGNKPLVQMNELLEAERQRTAKLEREMAELIERLGDGQPQKRGPGRPPKQEAA